MNKPLKISLICLLILIAFVLFSVGAFFVLIEPDIFVGEKLDIDKLTSQSRTITLLDARGNHINDAIYDRNKYYIDIDDLHENTVNAFIAVEDKRFYNHRGVDYKRMAAALISNIKSGKFSEGASTITQQLIKNTHLTNDKTINRKINELRLARKLERVYNKRQILEGYFNILYFGSGIRGLGTASRVMFDKPASQLTLAQSAALASIINNPSKYSPYGNYENLSERKALVLKLMLNQKLITQSEYDIAMSEHLVFNKNIQTQFIVGVLKNAATCLDSPEKTLFANNYTIKTSYNPDISHAAQSALKDIGTSYLARILVLENASGGVACDETNSAKYINPKRSPASTIKPFLSYAPALENGLNPLSQIEDVPTSFGNYSPGNYKGIYRGYQSLKDNLSNSSNVVAVKLLSRFGIEKSKAIACSFGLNFEQSDGTLALALGGMEKGVTLIELANAYRTLANGGNFSEVHYVESVYDNNNAIYTASRAEKNAVGADTAYLLTDMLKACAQYGTAKTLNKSGIIAAKTGTNGDARGNYDCYCIAYTSKYTLAVWFGADETPIENEITGATCCNTIKKMLENCDIGADCDFIRPADVAFFEVDGKTLNTTHEVYLADPFLPKRYRIMALLSKRSLPIRNNINLIDYYDGFMWN